MKKPQWKKPQWFYGTWKNWKRRSFHYYFVIIVVIVVVLAVSLSIGLASVVKFLLRNFTDLTVEITSYGFILASSVFIAWILSVSVGKILLDPLRKLQSAMNEVAEGDLTISIEEKSKFDEIENIYHSFNIMMKELRATEVLQSDFVSNVSHEFKTPINAIEGYSMLLQETENISDTQRLYIEKILFNTKRLSNLAGDILLLAKLENQAIQAQSKQFRLDEQVRRAILSQEIGWTEKNIFLDVEMEEIEYFGTEELLLHVWTNLLGNAVKFSPENGKVSIRLQQSEKSVLFSVSDEGPGITEEAQNHIFDKFYQGDKSHQQEGNGLGLALAKRIIDINDGKIEVQNLTEKGCCFTVILPKKKYT